MARSKTAPAEFYPTAAQAARFDMLAPMVDAAHEEISELSKKKPDGLLNSLKVRHVNKLLKDVRSCMGSDPSIEFLELLDEEQLPLNSDAVLILGQYRAAMKQFKEKHYRYSKNHHGHVWFTLP